MPRHGTLHMVAHNLADSIAGGLSFVLGVYEVAIWAEAQRAPRTGVVIDVLSGSVIEGPMDRPHPVEIAKACGAAFPRFCRQNDVRTEDYRLCHLRFLPAPPRYEVTVKDQRGRQSMRRYRGSPGRRERSL